MKKLVFIISVLLYHYETVKKYKYKDKYLYAVCNLEHVRDISELTVLNVKLFILNDSK